MATTIEHMQAEADAATGRPTPTPDDSAPPAAPAAVGGATPDDTTQPAAGRSATQPVVLDAATLEQLAAVFRADQQPARPTWTWQSSLLVAMAGALLAIAGGGFFSLRSDISTLGTSLRAEIGDLRAEMKAGDDSLRAEIGELRSEMTAADESLRAELREFRAEFNKVALDHTQRLARLEAAHPHPASQ